jgi:hypothetical protein
MSTPLLIKMFELHLEAFHSYKSILGIIPEDEDKTTTITDEY